jgi:hypothetical protein
MARSPSRQRHRVRRSRAALGRHAKGVRSFELNIVPQALYFEAMRKPASNAAHQCRTCDVDFIGDYCPKCAPDEVPIPGWWTKPLYRTTALIVSILVAFFIALFVMARMP